MEFPSGGLRTGSLFLRGKESWFLAISEERKAPRASRPLETCQNAASLCPHAALRRKTRAPLRCRADRRTGKKLDGRSVPLSLVSTSKPSSQSSLCPGRLRSAARPFRRKAVRGGSVSDSLAGFQRAASPLASFPLWKMQKILSLFDARKEKGCLRSAVGSPSMFRETKTPKVSLRNKSSRYYRLCNNIKANYLTAYCKIV